ncbi:ESF2 [Lepeophtheirus salmonis]|uniref:ESF2 n=1 Tax=Lepeophtheirus salmonis TaxID=72036 RepID=A0A7R8H657_LEPSM|nr:ESF2 [Lepeophtheirus salmonis]CAF2890589.1 ESF2 [Lepeophtheirus salmonis]
MSHSSIVNVEEKDVVLLNEDEDDEADDKEEVGGKAKGSCFVDHEEGVKMVKDETKEEEEKPGIIYLSSIPHGFNVSRTTAYFSKFGQVGRVFLQPNSRDKNKLKNTESAIFAKRKRQSTTQSPSPYKKSKREATIIPSKKARKNKGKGKSSTQKRSEFLKNVFGGSAD